MTTNLKETGFCWCGMPKTSHSKEALELWKIDPRPHEYVSCFAAPNVLSLLKEKDNLLANKELQLKDFRKALDLRDAEIKSVRESMARVIAAGDLQVKKIDEQTKEIQRLTKDRDAARNFLIDAEAEIAGLKERDAKLANNFLIDAQGIIRQQNSIIDRLKLDLKERDAEIQRLTKDRDAAREIDKQSKQMVCMNTEANCKLQTKEGYCQGGFQSIPASYCQECSAYIALQEVVGLLRGEKGGSK